MPMLNGQSYAAALAGHNHVSLSAPVVVPTGKFLLKTFLVLRINWLDTGRQ